MRTEGKQTTETKTCITIIQGVLELIRKWEPRCHCKYGASKIGMADVVFANIVRTGNSDGKEYLKEVEIGYFETGRALQYRLGQVYCCLNEGKECGEDGWTWGMEL